MEPLFAETTPESAAACVTGFVARCARWATPEADDLLLERPHVVRRGGEGASLVLELRARLVRHPVIGQDDRMRAFARIDNGALVWDPDPILCRVEVVPLNSSRSRIRVVPEPFIIEAVPAVGALVGALERDLLATYARREASPVTITGPVTPVNQPSTTAQIDNRSHAVSSNGEPDEVKVGTAEVPKRTVKPPRTPGRRSDWLRWQVTYRKVEREWRKGIHTYKSLYDWLKDTAPALAKKAGPETLAEIVAAGEAGELEHNPWATPPK